MRQVHTIGLCLVALFGVPIVAAEGRIPIFETDDNYRIRSKRSRRVGRQVASG